MRSRWSDAELEALLARYPGWPEDLVACLYASRLLGAEPALALHGGGNTSVKLPARDLLGEEVPGLYVKGSGRDLAGIEPEDFSLLDLDRAARLVGLGSLPDSEIARCLRICALVPEAPPPSIETPLHASLPSRFVLHTHAEAILSLTNRVGGAGCVAEALGRGVIVLPYVRPGLELAAASRTAILAEPRSIGMVWVQHGLLSWGPTAKDAYDRTVDLVSRAEAFLSRERARSAVPSSLAVTEPIPHPGLARQRMAELAPRMRGLLSAESGNPDRPFERPILASATDAATLLALASHGAEAQVISPPLTSDHLIRIGREPLWLAHLPWTDLEALDSQLRGWVEAYERRTGELPRTALVPGVGVVGRGRDAREAGIALDLALQNLMVKTAMVSAGVRYQGLEGEHLREAEHRPLQQAKLERSAQPMGGTVAILTGAAGAIGSGCARVLLEAGAHVALADLAGERLTSLAAELETEFPGRVLAAEMDVTSGASVAAGFAAACCAWGGVDLVVANAGLAHVAPLAELELEELRRLERVNLEGTLHTLAEAARLFRLQGTGGDVVLVSTKNVPAPGASFGAYSATKAAAHQLARVASLELAELGVRVNMVAPDAVFGDAGRPSGLWQEVGPARMKARGLDSAGLEDYYRQRNLLKARVTARHVGEAVLFFALRKTPTTGATLPVDGGLPDATPR